MVRRGRARDVVLDDADLAATELGRVAAAWRASSPDWIGGESGDEARLPVAVDPTVWGFGGPAAGLAELSRRSGVAIVAGVGAYVPQDAAGVADGSSTRTRWRSGSSRR